MTGLKEIIVSNNEAQALKLKKFGVFPFDGDQGYTLKGVQLVKLNVYKETTV